MADETKIIVMDFVYMMGRILKATKSVKVWQLARNSDQNIDWIEGNPLTISKCSNEFHCLI